MLEKDKLKIVFLWHWLKKVTDEKDPVFAVTDSLINAIGKLSSIYKVNVVALSKNRNYEIFSNEQNIDYIFRDSLKEASNELIKINPDVLFISHHPSRYDKLQKDLESIKAIQIIYYSAPINELNKYHKKLYAHIVHHEYQKEILRKKDIASHKIFVAPKTANLDMFKPIQIEKKWDCIYPMRGNIGYWKRPELAIEACRINNMSIIMPGANIPPEYDWVTTFDKWIKPEDLAMFYNQSKCLVITSDNNEMGPRVIPEAAACNIPIVCCSDSLACVSHVKKIGGYIAKPNPQDIAQKLELAIQEKRVNTRQKLIELNFDYDLIYRTLSNIFKTIELEKQNKLEKKSWIDPIKTKLENLRNNL